MAYKYKKGDLVQVTWRDAEFGDHGWIDTGPFDDWASEEIEEISTVGTLAFYGPKHIVVVQTADSANNGNGFKIPKECVVKMKRLKPS